MSEVARDLLAERIKRSPPRSQREIIQLTVRQSIAAFGAVHSDEKIRAASFGIASGLFGDNYTPEQFILRVKICDEEYRAALARATPDTRKE